jgi:hypothetical protein
MTTLTLRLEDSLKEETMFLAKKIRPKLEPTYKFET